MFLGLLQQVGVKGQNKDPRRVSLRHFLPQQNVPLTQQSGLQGAPVVGGGLAAALLTGSSSDVTESLEERGVGGVESELTTSLDGVGVVSDSGVSAGAQRLRAVQQPLGTDTHVKASREPVGMQKDPQQNSSPAQQFGWQLGPAQINRALHFPLSAWPNKRRVLVYESKGQANAV